MGGFIWGMTGVEGSGKSCAMAGIALEHSALVAKANGYKTAEAYCSDPNNKKPIQCFDGFEIHGSRSLRQEHIKFSSVSDKAKWLSNFGADEFKNLFICIDEIQNYMDSQQSMSVFGRLLNHALAQRRRAGLGIMFTIQNIDWLNKRMRWSCHYISVCRDLSRTPWGKAEGVKKGEQLAFYTYDCKGFITGREYAGLGTIRINGQKIWPFYDSFAPADLTEEQFISKKQQTIIDWSSLAMDDEVNDPHLSDLDKRREEIMAMDEEKIMDTDFSQFPVNRMTMKNGKKEINADLLFDN